MTKKFTELITEIIKRQNHPKPLWELGLGKRVEVLKIGEIIKLNTKRNKLRE
jgi:hypothetical protein